MMKSRRRGISWHQFSRRNFGKSLNMNFISSKKHESIFSKNEPTFLFLGEVIPITNQRTDSHPCIRFLHNPPCILNILVFDFMHPKHPRIHASFISNIWISLKHCFFVFYWLPRSCQTWTPNCLEMEILIWRPMGLGVHVSRSHKKRWMPRAPGIVFLLVFL